MSQKKKESCYKTMTTIKKKKPNTMKQSVLSMDSSEIEYIPNLLPYLIDGFFKECQLKDYPSFLGKNVGQKQEVNENSSIEKQGTNFMEKSVVEDNNLIGIGNLLQQRDKIYYEKGKTFNIMIYGKPGVGKSTIIKNLFGLSSFSDKGPRKHKLEIVHQESGVKINLNIQEMCQIDNKLINSYNWIPMINDMEGDNIKYVFEERQQDRRDGRIIDNRIHVCLFVMEPQIQFNDMDIITMKEISEQTNLVPVINKIDISNKEELEMVQIGLDRIFEIYGIVPYGDGKAIYANDTDVSSLQKMIIDNNMIDLIDTMENEYEIKRSHILKKNVNSIKVRSDKEGKEINIWKDWWWKEPFLKKQIEIRQNYRELMGTQNLKFQEWIGMLIHKQEQYNDIVESILNKIKLVRLECQELEANLINLCGSEYVTDKGPHNGGGNSGSSKTLVVMNQLSDEEG